MTKNSKRPGTDLPAKIAQVLANLGSSEGSRLEGGIGEASEFAPQIEPTMTVLLRGLNNPAENVRYQAFQCLLLAFPSAATSLHRLEASFHSEDPKDRLAGVRNVIIILANALADLAGTKLDESPPTGGESDTFTEELMEHAGRWVAWSQDRKQILAVADSFAEVMEQAEAAGESDPYVKKAPGIAPNTAFKPFQLLEDESPNVIDDVKKVFPTPDAWLNAPNDALGGDKPFDLIGTVREPEVRYLLRGIANGITT